jgi:hypothetical protein
MLVYLLTELFRTHESCQLAELSIRRKSRRVPIPATPVAPAGVIDLLG